MVCKRYFCNFFPSVNGYGEGTFLSDEVISNDGLSQFPLAALTGNGHIQCLEPSKVL